MNNIFDNHILKRDAIKKIRKIIFNCSHFKIGKTGQNLLDRFNSEYKNMYDKIECVHKSSDSTKIDELEKYLISNFKENGISELKRKSHELLTNKTIPKCDNDAVGCGEMEDSDTYYVYVVVKK